MRPALVRPLLAIVLTLFFAVWPARALPQALASTTATASPTSTGLHVVGNQLVNGEGQAIRLLGAGRAGTEYACSQGWGIADGPMDQASVSAMLSWGLDAVRIPLNEDCWLGINGVKAQYSGSSYRTVIETYVHLLEANHLTPILDLHSSAPGSTLSTGQSMMADQDHAPAFWASISTSFYGDNAIVFDLFNEPHITSWPVPVPSSDWQCWRDGGTCAGVSYQVAGMQELVNTIRAAGNQNVLLLGGMDWAGDLSQWLQYAPSDPLHNLAASWHTYPGTACMTSPCIDGVPTTLAATVPLVLGEIGDHNSQPVSFTPSMLAWADQHHVSYIAWAWDAWTGSDNILIGNYSGAPAPNWGQEYHDHLAALASATTTSSSSSTAATSSSTTATTSTGSSTASSSTSSSSAATTGVSSSTVASSSLFTTTSTSTAASSSLASSTTTSTSRPVAPTFSSSAMSDPAVAGPGSPVTIRATISDQIGVLQNGIVDLEVYNAAGGKIWQRAFSGQNLAAGQSATYASSWTAPSADGVYIVKLGVFGQNWSGPYLWNDDAAAITVAAPTFSSSATASPVGVGATTTITATITALAGTLSDGIIDVEVANAAGQKVGQQFFSGQTLHAGQVVQDTVRWTPTAQGTYTVKIGVFGANWSPLYTWNNRATIINVL